MNLDPSILGNTEGYINNRACTVLDSPSNWKMVAQAAQEVAMVLFLIFHSLASLLEPIKRPDPASIEKMIAEGGLKEIISFLG